MKVLQIIKNIPFFFWMLRKRIKLKNIDEWANEYIKIKLKELNIEPTKQ